MANTPPTPKPVKVEILPYMGPPKDTKETPKPHPDSLSGGTKRKKALPTLDSTGDYAAGGRVTGFKGYGKAKKV